MREQRRGRNQEPAPASQNRGSKSDTNAKKEPESATQPEASQNDDISVALSFQRQLNEKPDIDFLYNSLMQIYNNVEVNNAKPEGNQETLDRILFTALRVKARVASNVCQARWRMQAILNQSRRLSYKSKVVKKNLPKIERNYIAMCRDGHKSKGVNDLYERLNKVLGKIPSLAQLEARAQQLRSKQSNILVNIETVKRQIELQKSQLENMCRIMLQGMSQ